MCAARAGRVGPLHSNAKRTKEAGFELGGATMERGRLKQRISAVFRASLRTSCSIVNSRKAAEAVQEPVYVSRRYTGEEVEEGVLGGLDRSLSLPPPAAEPLVHQRRRETAAGGSPRLSVDCSTCRPTTVKAKKKEKRAPEAGAFCEAAGGEGEGRKRPPVPADQSPSYSCFKQMQEEMKREEKKLAAKKKKEKKLLSNGYGFTSSSEDSDNDDDDLGDLFSSDGDQGLPPRKGSWSRERAKEGEAEALFSSRSISSDSSEFYYRASRRHAGKKKQPSRRRQRKPRKGDQPGGRRSRHTSCDESFRPAVSIPSCSPSSHAVPAAARAAAQLVEEDEVDVGREGFAVEKQSSDPHADFRSSMLEMIVEKQLFGARELEQLLCCYLVLNSPCHHAVIFEVFSEICETLFLN